MSNEKYCGDVLYQKTYTKDYLSHKTVKNKDILPQWYWENDHQAIISKKKWEKVQELLAAKSWRSCGRIAGMKKKFTVTRVKNGALRGFLLIDLTWNSEERSKFLELMDGSNDEPGVMERKRR